MHNGTAAAAAGAATMATAGAAMRAAEKRLAAAMSAAARECREMSVLSVRVEMQRAPAFGDGNSPVERAY